MATTKAIDTCQRSLQGHLLAWPPSRSVGAVSLKCSPRRTRNIGMVTMMCAKDPHTTLGVAHGANKQEIKVAYRRLALRYHPDVCKGDQCTTKFQHIHSAYEAILSSTTMPQEEQEVEEDSSAHVEGLMGVGDDSWDEWEDWMGWEGASTLDHLDPMDPIDN